MTYSPQYVSIQSIAYDDTVDRIIRSGILEDKDEGQSNAPFTFTTGIE